MLEVDVAAKYFRGLGDRTRLRILEALKDGERSVGQLVELLDEPEPNLSAHLACLRWCGFVETRRNHRSVRYRIADSRVLRMLELADSLLENNGQQVDACRQIDA